ncbi:MAG TPA: YndJ family transporter [Candidatus Polarisedimenticolia bacterium]|nr:YndJ family transporter [Candidatus Polarisedimenticolia bacterium]
MKDGRTLLAASAGFGGLAWVFLAIAATAGRAPLGGLELLFLVAPLVVVPLGLRLYASNGLLRLACWLQAPAAVIAVASFWMARGPAAAALASGWLAVAGLAGLSGASALLRGGWRLDAGTCAGIGLVYLPVGAAWLVASRLGVAPLGFGEPIVLLTAVHFHFAGFAAAVFAAATLRVARAVGRLDRAVELVVVFGIVAGPALVAAGFLTTAAVSLGATSILATCLGLLAVLTWICLPRLEAGLFRALLVLSSTSIVASMLLAVAYAWGEFIGRSAIDIPHMVRLHGALNALGFAASGLLAWNVRASGGDDPDRSRRPGQFSS